MPYKNIRGRQMHYTEYGQGDPILLGHSYLWDSNMWQPQIDELSKTNRLIVPDLWGHGKSETRDEKKYTIDKLAQDHLDLMNELGIDKFAIIGLSVGGMWGARIAIDEPERVTSLVLMDTDLGKEPLELKTRYFGLIEMIQQLGNIPANMIEAITPLFFSPETIKNNTTLVDSFQSRLAEIPEERIDTIATIGRSIFSRESMLMEAGRLGIPVQIIVGADDMSRPVKESKLMAKTIHGAKLSIIKDAGHISNLEKPEKVTALLKNFIENTQNLKISA